MKKINQKKGFILALILCSLIFSFIPHVYAGPTNATEPLDCEQVAKYDTYNFDTTNIILQGWPGYYTENDIIIASSALKCIKEEYIGTDYEANIGNDGMGIDTTVYSQTYAKAIIKKYQAERALYPDGIIGIQTAFDMGVLIGNLNHSNDYKCSIIKVGYSVDQQGTNTPFYSARSIPQTGNFNTSNSDQHEANKEFLTKIIGCLELYEGDNKTPYGEDGFLDPTKVTEIDAYYGTDNGKNVAGAALMFNLGRRFGEAGGMAPERPEIPIYEPDDIDWLDIELDDIEIETNNQPVATSGTENKPENETKKKDEDQNKDSNIEEQYYDPCAQYNEYAKNNNLVPNMEFSGQKWSLVPESPGTFDWQDATLEEYLGGGRNTNDALYRYECLTGPAVIMSIIWKIEYFFETMLAVISVAMFLYGGYLYLVAGGEEGMVDKATKSITWSIIGIVIVVSSRVIVSLLIPRQDNTILYDEEKLLSASATDPARESLIGIANFGLGLVASIAVLMIIYGGYLYVISNGDESMESKAKTILVEAIIGLIIIVISYTLVGAIFGAANVAI